jgi:hypothetical protein
MMKMKYLLMLVLALSPLFPVMGEELTDEEWNAQAQEAFARVLAVYPEARDTSTYFGSRMIEIDEEWGDAMDPRFDDPQKPILIARIILAEIEEAKAKKRARAERRRAVAVTSPAPMNADELGYGAHIFGRGPAPKPEKPHEVYTRAPMKVEPYRPSIMLTPETSGRVVMPDGEIIRFDRDEDTIRLRE